MVQAPGKNVTRTTHQVGVSGTSTWEAATLADQGIGGGIIFQHWPGDTSGSLSQSC